MEALRVSLDLYDVEVVKQIAATLGLRDAETKLTKPKLVQRLLTEIPRRAGSPEFIKALSETDRAVLALTLEKGGQLASANLLPPLILAGLLPLPPSNTVDDITRKLEALLEPLLQHGLLVNLTLPNSYTTRRQLRPLREIGVPPEVAQALPRQLLKAPKADLQRFAAPEPSRVSAGDPEVLLRQLFFVWTALLRAPARRLKSGLIAKTDLRRLSRDLGLDLETQEELLRYLIALLQMVKLVQISGDAFAAVDDDHAQRLWQQDLGAQLREFLMAFINLEGYPKVDMGTVYIPGYGYNQFMCNPTKTLNHQLLAAFQQLLALSWFSFDMLMVLLNRGKPGGFAFPDAVIKSLEQQLRWTGMNAGGTPVLPKVTKELQDLDIAVARDLLEQWRWLGIVELGYVPGKELPWAVRLAPVGRAALQQEAFAINGDIGQLILQPDFQVLALGPVPLVTLLGIERIAERETVQPAAVGYRLTRNSIYRALQNGASIGVICAFLSRITQQPLPQNVERTLEEWGAQHERIIVRRDVLVVQTDAAAQLEALLADPRLSQWLQRLDERTAWADAQYTKKIQTRLWQLELLPAISKGPEADLPRSLLWEEGRLLPRTTPTSLYVTAVVRGFAAQEADGWRVTPVSVREAINTGLSAPEILAQIERLTGATLSPEWQTRLKAWSSHYGSAHTLQVRLLRMESAAVLAEVRGADRQLSRWLRPLEGESGLALIDDRHWEAALELLAALGVSIETGRWW